MPEGHDATVGFTYFIIPDQPLNDRLDEIGNAGRCPKGKSLGLRDMPRAQISNNVLKNRHEIPFPRTESEGMKVKMLVESSA